jgi:hypothetical protein
VVELVIGKLTKDDINKNVFVPRLPMAPNAKALVRTTFGTALVAGENLKQH